jgi:spoIIIJ-associated protein
MKTIEVLSKTKEEALAKAAATLDLELSALEISDEFEPDEEDLKTFAAENNLAAPPSGDDLSLFEVRVKFDHYLNEAKDWSQGLVERFAPGSTAEAVRFKKLIIVRLNVPEANILIGKLGATLDAFQHVVVRALLTLDDQFPDVMLDVGKFREKKLIRLEKEAMRAADKANKFGRRVPLPPMSPAERKFVHNILKDLPGIKTESRGEDRERHIVVESTNPPTQRNDRGAGGGGDRGDRGNRSGGGGFSRGGDRGNRPGGPPRGPGGGGNRGGGFRDGNRPGGQFSRDPGRFGNRADRPEGQGVPDDIGNREPGAAGGGFNRGGGNRPGGNRDGNRGGGGNRDFNRSGPPRQGNDRPAGPKVTDEQRRLLYGGAGQQPENYRDEKIEGNSSMLPRYQERPDEDAQPKRFEDEIDDKL